MHFFRERNHYRRRSSNGWHRLRDDHLHRDLLHFGLRVCNLLSVRRALLPRRTLPRRDRKPLNDRNAVRRGALHGHGFIRDLDSEGLARTHARGELDPLLSAVSQGERDVVAGAAALRGGD